MFIVVGIVAFALFIALWSRGARRHGPALLLLAGIALGCFCLTAALQGFIGDLLQMDHPTGASVNLALLWAGVVSIPAAILLVLISAVWAVRRASRL